MITKNRLVLALVAMGTAGAVAGGVVALATVGTTSAGAPAGTKVNSTNTPGTSTGTSPNTGTSTSTGTSPSPSTSTTTDRNGRGRHGGGSVVSVSQSGGILLPASWPTAIPVPVGKISASTTRPRVWLLIITEQGSLSQVRAKVIRLFAAHGFVNKLQPTTLIVLQNANYRVTAFLASHDHSATTTDMRLELDALTPAAGRA